MVRWAPLSAERALPEPAPQRLFTGPFVLCSLANFAQCLAFNLFLHLPGYLRDIGASEVEIGFLFGLTAVAAVAVRPPVGRAMDTRGRREIFLVGGALNTAVCALYLTVDGIGPWIFAVRIVHGLAVALLFTSLFTFAADHVPPQRRTEGLALFGVSGMLPISLGGVLGDLVLRRADYPALFSLAALLAATSFLLSLPLFDDRKLFAGATGSRGFREALLQRDLLPLWWIGTVFALALASVFSFLKLYVEATDRGSVGGFFSAYAATAIVLRLFLGWLPDRVGPKRLLFPSLAALAAGCTTLAVATDADGVLAAGALCGIGHGYTFPILFGMVVSRTADSERGTTMAIFTALFDLGLLIGGPSFGVIIHRAGFEAAFASAAGAIGVGAAVFAAWDRGR